MSDLLFTKSPSNPKLQKVSPAVVVCHDEGCDKADIEAMLCPKRMTQTVRPKGRSKAKGNS